MRSKKIKEYFAIVVTCSTPLLPLAYKGKLTYKTEIRNTKKEVQEVVIIPCPVQYDFAKSDF